MGPTAVGIDNYGGIAMGADTIARPGPHIQGAPVTWDQGVAHFTVAASMLCDPLAEQRCDRAEGELT